MNNYTIVEKLKNWRGEQAMKENCELFRILSNGTIEEIASILPRNKEELLKIKGIKERKFEKYGKDILRIVTGLEEGNDSESNDENTLFSFLPKGNKDEKEKIYSVGDFLDLVNQNLSGLRASIRGEITSLDQRGNYLFFSLKDKETESLINCFMWRSDYEICKVEISEGMEIIAHGTPEVYKRSGRFTFRTDAIELFGEGALKKAYDELKRKLEEEGLFLEERKKPLAEYPHRIGLITSRDGAVINDFLNNIGRYGYKITFVDSRVEGVMAVKDLVEAVRFFKKHPVDVLVIIRGGGSLESLQAFNNEALIREVVGLEIPLMCGIGHDKDVPLLSYVADQAYSTPSIVAREINQSWEKGVEKLGLYQVEVLNAFDRILKDSSYNLERVKEKINTFFQDISNNFKEKEQSVKHWFLLLNQLIKIQKEKIERGKSIILSGFENKLNHIYGNIDQFERNLKNNDPSHQLKLGYSILTLQGKVVRSVKDLKKGDEIRNKLSDGEVVSEVRNN